MLFSLTQIKFLTYLSAFIGVLMVALLILRRINFWQMWKESGLSIFSLHPYMGRQYAKIAADAEKQKSQTAQDFTPKKLTDEEKRKAFKDFLMTLPAYTISDNIAAGFIRGLMERGGAKYKKIVLIDSSSVDDSYLYARVDGDYFISNGGFYLIPWDNAKTILYWDINDSRPLIDKSKESKWYDPRMNARYTYGIFNKISIQGQKPAEGINGYYLIAAVLIIIIAIGISGYTTHADVIRMYPTLTNMTAEIIKLGS